VQVLLSASFNPTPDINAHEFCQEHSDTDKAASNTSNIETQNPIHAEKQSNGNAPFSSAVRQQCPSLSSSVVPKNNDVLQHVLLNHPIEEGGEIN
jgi:hypothetical protein